MKAGMYVRLFYSVLGEKVERLIFPDAMEVAKFMTGLPLVISYSFDKHFTYKVQQPTYGALHFSLKR